MVHIDRKKVAAPKILSDPNERGHRETQQAIAHFNGPDREEPFDFSVYRHETVKEALVKLFHEKCAYCESVFLHTYPGDVEHFRPKSEVTEANPTKPGYYWLAADWDNLLLSCRNCNQKLSHKLFTAPGKKTMGKMNQFPLLNDDTYRVKAHNTAGGIQNEEPYRLLVNPCIDNPEEYFEYDEVHAIIKARSDDPGKIAKANKSIEVYVLQRVPLVLAREKILIEILAQIQRVKEAVKNVNDNAEAEPAIQFYFDKILTRELLRLKKAMEPSEPYSAMAKQIIHKFFIINFGFMP